MCVFCVLCMLRVYVYGMLDVVCMCVSSVCMSVMCSVYVCKLYFHLSEFGRGVQWTLAVDLCNVISAL